MKKPTSNGSTPTAAPKIKKTTAPSARELQPPVTRIRALVDVGFGNELTIRGKGAGLSWDKGMRMSCTNADLWTVALIGACTPVLFKVLVNDTTWSAGEDFVALPGSDITVTPAF